MSHTSRALPEDPIVVRLSGTQTATHLTPTLAARHERAVHLAAIAVLSALLSGACAAKATGRHDASKDEMRLDAIERAAVWRPTDVARMNVRRGPVDKDSFAPNELVNCVYVDREMSGTTPKFTCRLPNGDDVKVKYGLSNGEVYAEVAATRLLWALGFGADHMYPVRVRCTGCPTEAEKQREEDDKAALERDDRIAPEKVSRKDAPVENASRKDEKDTRPGAAERRVVMYEAAAIERKPTGYEIKDSKGEGWSWPELDLVKPSRGGAPLAQRDALKLLAVMLQHTDSKRQQQRLVCLTPLTETGYCARPFMLINDLGRTFGKATLLNGDRSSSVNPQAWADSPIWDGKTGCRAHLPASITGTLDSPVISEEGRRFLANLLGKLTDQQLRDLFTVARFEMRDAATRGDAVDVREWVRIFKDKVAQISSRNCLAA